MLHCLNYSQKLPITLEKAWEFFSNPENLKILTPSYLNFEILSRSGDKIYAGQIIDYTIRPIANIPISWVTEITQVKDFDYFIDEQRFGPYSFWHHEHRFIAIPGGVEILDIVYFKMPLGALGELLYQLKVKKDLENIFSYRKTTLETSFGFYH